MRSEADHPPLVATAGGHAADDDELAVGLEHRGARLDRPPATTSRRAMPSRANAGSSRPSVVDRTALNTGTSETSAHPTATMPPSGWITTSVNCSALGLTSTVSRPSSPNDRSRPSVPQVSSHRGPARDAVRRRAGDDDATAGRDRHGRGPLEPPSEAGERRAGVREPRVERSVRPIPLDDEPIRCGGPALPDHHDAAVVLDRQVERVVVRAQIRHDLAGLTERRVQSAAGGEPRERDVGVRGQGRAGDDDAVVMVDRHGVRHRAVRERRLDAVVTEERVEGAGTRGRRRRGEREDRHGRDEREPAHVRSLRPGRYGTILEMGSSRMSVAPAAFSWGISVLTRRFSTTVSMA